MTEAELGISVARRAKKELPAEGMVNRKKVRDRIRYQMIDNIMINGLYEDTKRKAEKRVEWWEETSNV